MKLMYEHVDASFEKELNESTGEKKYRIKGIFSSPGVKNRNGRVYPMELWEPEVSKYQDIIKTGHPNSLMELEHPPRSNVDMMEAVAKIEKLYIQEGKVLGEAVLLDNPKANQLKTLIDAGIKMSVSSRGLGSVKNGLVESFKLVTFDIIPNLGQSDYSAEMYGIVEGVLENKEFIINESGKIEEVEMCTESACHMFEKEEIQGAIMEKFKEFLNSKQEVNERLTFDDMSEETEKLFDLLLDLGKKGYVIKHSGSNGINIKSKSGAVAQLVFDPSNKF